MLAALYMRRGHRINATQLQEYTAIHTRSYHLSYTHHARLFLVQILLYRRTSIGALSGGRGGSSQCAKICSSCNPQGPGTLAHVLTLVLLLLLHHTNERQVSSAHVLEATQEKEKSRHVPVRSTCRSLSPWVDEQPADLVPRAP